MPIHKQNGSSVSSTDHWPKDVGIVAIEFVFPKTFVDQNELEIYDKVSQGKYTIGLGQARMGFCSDRIDINSLCLTVTQRLIEKTGIQKKDVGFLMVGTETLVDKSKSVKSVLMQLFEESGNSNIEGLDTTNACYGGTAALLHAINWIESSSYDGRHAIVVAADIAIYAVGSARPTGGCGAVAMLIGPNAPLVIDRGVKHTHMAHSYDFYKPDMSSEYPTVDGKLTISCYISALDKCYKGFCENYEKKLLKEGQKSNATLDTFDALLFHTPYCKLVQKSAARLAYDDFIRDPKPNSEKYKGFEKFKTLTYEESIFDKDLEKAFLSVSSEIFSTKIKPSLLLASEIGNMYTASLYSCLVAFLLSKPVNDLINNRLLMFSYGSGLASTMFSITVSSDGSSGSPLDQLLQGIKEVPQLLANRIKVNPEKFEETLKHREETHHLHSYTPTGSIQDLFPGSYYLISIDSMYRRKYERLPISEEPNCPRTSIINDHKITSNTATLKNGQQSLPTIHAL